jgi:hypothetical protein
MNLDRVSFYDATEFLKDITGAKLDVHWPALQAAGVKKTSPITVRLTNTPLRAVLSVLLQSAQTHSKEPLDYKIRNGVIHISTVADLKPPAAAKN